MGEKARIKTEFGAKIHMSLVDGFSFLDSWFLDAFIECSHLSNFVEKYRKRFGFYPAKVFADKLYGTRENRAWLKEKNTKQAAIS